MGVSTIDAILVALPSMVESNWKSKAYTTFDASAHPWAGTTTGRCVYAGCARAPLQALVGPQPVHPDVVHTSVPAVAQRGRPRRDPCHG
ncbi:hypothetical protein I546_2689 [Mycobacterium kansasii 732]|nr:hypothetical protein I546_2689 [Mycobacterium kansasii 732]